MAKLSNEELIALKDAVEKRIFSSGAWLHVKTGQVYAPEGTVFMVGAGEIGVIYKPVAKDGDPLGYRPAFVRPFSEWEEVVDGEPRFVPVREKKVSVWERK